jgi:prepilin peptidase CpaA
MALLIMVAFLWSISLIALLLSATTDLRDRIIPNELVLLIAASGLAMGLITRPELLPVSLLAAFIVLMGLGVLSHFDVMGGGDVKLIAALSLLVAPQQIGSLLLGIMLAGGLLGGLYYVARHRLARRIAVPSDAGRAVRRNGRLSTLAESERARIAAGEPMPYALAITGGVLAHIASVMPQCFSGISCSL